jgi:hypothetical protein
MGLRGPRPKGSRSRTLRGGVSAVYGRGAEEAESVADARDRVPEEGRPFFDRLTGSYGGWGPASLELAIQAARASARVEEAREVVEREGLVVAGTRGGKVRNPALLVETAAASELRAALRALRLDEAGE